MEPLGYEYRAGEHRMTRATPSWTNGLGTVNSLARTCQHTFYACIPVLWRVQSGIENLTRCLPPGAWDGQFPPTNESGSQLGSSSSRILMRPEGIWSRFNLYARYVQTLLLPREGLSNRNYSLWRSCRSPPMSEDSTPLLPALQEIYWSDVDSLEAIYMFLGPSITFLSCILDDVGLQSSQFLKVLPRYCPQLLDLDLIMPEDPDRISDLLEMLPSLRALRLFHCRGLVKIPIALLLRAAGLPALRTLDLTAESAWQDDDSPLTSEVSFDALKTLYLSIWTTCDWKPVFKSFRFPALVNFRVGLMIAGEFGSVSILELLGLLHTQISAESLRKIDISEYSGFHSRHPQENNLSVTTAPLSYHAIEPLQAFSRLTWLCFSPLLGVALDDQSFIKFIACFPHLQTLRLLTDKMLPPSVLSSSRFPTLRVFPSMLRLCPDLEEISMTVDATSVPELDIEGRPVNLCICEIKLPHSPVTKDHAAIAGFLHALFPNLVDINAGTQREYFQDWREIEMRIAELVAHDSGSSGQGAPEIAE
ncbi:hypothetical protein BC629DRAFT_565653 [Irpex lacteus]|nr:hypothetical protein BC629DRAFT_565653 [Irpex lacteus]